jgi:hypothetical protein
LPKVIAILRSIRWPRVKLFLVSGDHLLPQTSSSIAFRHPKRYPQDSSFARPNTLTNHQSNPHSIALSPNTLRTIRVTSKSLFCKAERPLQPTRATPQSLFRTLCEPLEQPSTESTIPYLWEPVEYHPTLWNTLEALQSHLQVEPRELQNPQTLPESRYFTF